VIDDPQVLVAAVESARARAAAGGLVTFGIQPTAPETGFGYIRLESAPDGGQGPLPIAEFVEKPNAGQAREFVESGQYFWNSGIFLFQAQAYLDHLERFAPAILEANRRAMDAAAADRDFIRPDPETFAESPADSIDYAVMEKTDAAYMVPIHTDWSDVGSWSALYEVSPKDEAGNVIQGDVLTAGDRNCYLRAESRLLATAGLEGHVVVETPDAVLVAHKDRAQEVKGLVQNLEASNRSECDTHKTVYRPWGTYEQMNCGERFQVKHIFVKPGEKLSLQMHHHRAEHWVVVKGTARVHLDGKEFILSEDESTYVPIGSRHRVENPGSIPLELIEVQTGSYLGEDDIVRFEDTYGRQ
jgi:mannose-1-phosphate guanylyltransferase/mannose-6-phosphate isomerase